MSNNKHSTLVKEINKALSKEYKGIFVKFPASHIDYMIEMAKEDGEEKAPILLEYVDEEMTSEITLEKASEIEAKLDEVCSKSADYLTTEICSSGYGYEIYFVMKA